MSFSSTSRNFRPLINIESAPMCEFLNGTKTNAAIKWLIGMIEKKIPKGIIHPCPYFVNINKIINRNC